MNDSDFNDFTTFEHGRTYDIYVTNANGVTFSVTGKTPAVAMTHSIIAGDNFISPTVTAATSISTLLATWDLSLGTDISDIKRFNTTTDTWESYASSQFTNFEPGKGYIIVGLQNASFEYGADTETTTTFVYDATGSRVKKTADSTTTIYLGKDYEVESSTSTKHIFLGDRRITTKKSDGTLQYIHSDHINSSNVITDGDGNQSSLLEYDPYGSTVTHTGNANPKHKFTGQEEDDSTKLYYYGARYYDPQIGRFVTADPFVQAPEDPQSFNRYAYARNNPIIFTDPTGNFFWFIAAAIVAIAQAAAAAAAAVATAVISAVSAIASAIGSVLGSIGNAMLHGLQALGGLAGGSTNAVPGIKAGIDLGAGAAMKGVEAAVVTGTMSAPATGASSGLAIATGTAVAGSITAVSLTSSLGGNSAATTAIHTSSSFNEAIDSVKDAVLRGPAPGFIGSPGSYSAPLISPGGEAVLAPGVSLTNVSPATSNIPKESTLAKEPRASDNKSDKKPDIKKKGTKRNPDGSKKSPVDQFDQLKQKQKLNPKLVDSTGKTEQNLINYLKSFEGDASDINPNLD